MQKVPSKEICKYVCSIDFGFKLLIRDLCNYKKITNVDSRKRAMFISSYGINVNVSQFSVPDYTDILVG